MTRILSPAFSLFATLFALAVAAPVSAQSFSTLEERMSAAQFQAAGLDKLSPDELKELNRWLQQNVSGAGVVAGATAAAPAGTAPATDSTGFRSDKSTKEIISPIVGEFRGWTGKTVFHLENGQVWQQTESRRWEAVRLDKATAIIKPGFMNSWILKIDGYNTTTRVKRIQ